MEILIGRRMTEKAQVTEPQRITPFSATTARQPLTKLSAQQLRRWADTSEWVRAAINHRRVQVSQSRWHITPIDPQKEYSEEQQALLTLLFLHPNEKQKTFRKLIEPVVEDILVLDAGVVEKEMNLRGLTVALHLVDGATIRIRPLWNGDPNDPRYEWWPRGSFVANLLDSQILHMMANPSSHRATGFSALEALKSAIDADLEAAEFNKRGVQQTSPTGFVNLGENVGPQQADAFRSYYEAEVAGRKQLGFIAGVKNPEFINTGQTAREMQFMQWQVYLLRKIAAVFGIAPQDLGITFDVNRANAQTQQELSEDRGLRPLLTLIEEQINSQVVADFARSKALQLYSVGDIDVLTFRKMVALSHADPREHADVFQKLPDANILNLMFKFRLRSSKSARDQAEFNRRALAGFPWYSVNEARAEDGLDPKPGGDEIIVNTPVGPMTLEDIVNGTATPVAPPDEEEEETEEEQEEKRARLHELARRRQEYLNSLTRLPAARITPSPVTLDAEDGEDNDREPVIVEVPVEVDAYGDPVDE